MRSDDDPLAVLPLDAFDAAEPRKHAARRDVEHAAIAVFDQCAAAARLANDPIGQHLLGRLRFARTRPSTADAAGRLRSGCSRRRRRRVFLLQPLDRFGEPGKLRGRFGLGALQTVETLGELSKLTVRPACRCINIGLQRRHISRLGLCCGDGAQGSRIGRRGNRPKMLDPRRRERTDERPDRRRAGERHSHHGEAQRTLRRRGAASGRSRFVGGGFAVRVRLPVGRRSQNLFRIHLIVAEARRPHHRQRAVGGRAVGWHLRQVLARHCGHVRRFRAGGLRIGGGRVIRRRVARRRLAAGFVGWLFVRELSGFGLLRLAFARGLFRALVHGFWILRMVENP